MDQRSNKPDREPEPPAIIIGAGPAGLTAAYELLKRSSIRPIVLEQSHEMGGISRTVRYKGNRMDIGGHRFFSKSDRVMQWWLNILPLEDTGEIQHTLAYHRQLHTLAAVVADPEAKQQDRVMLVRRRKSRIYFLRKFFDYPLKLSPATLRQLGAVRTVKIGISYAWSALRQIRPERTLEDFFINRFGRQLYRTFFQSYTEKVWGVPCQEISAEWGAQRIKGLSLTKALLHFVRKAIPARAELSHKQTETSLIEKFLYPKFGPGQLWECVAAQVRQNGGTILTGWKVDRLHVHGNRIVGVSATHESGESRRFPASYVFSTMPVQELVRALDVPAPPAVNEVSEGLLYRDFITVGLLLDRLAINECGREEQHLEDNWIYIQEPDVLVGRMQIFNNWSPHLVADPSKVWIGLEYFCYETDPLWEMPDHEIVQLAVGEMQKIGILRGSDVRDATVIRVPKAYPAYFGTYERFSEVRTYLDQFENLFLVGRNGMHKYNNQDHSMLTAMTAVDNILAGRTDKSNLWAVNTEQGYHEAKTDEPQTAANAEKPVLVR